MDAVEKESAGRRRIGILGGSFDPVHLGHLGMADAARDAAGLDSVVFVPCFVSPLKTGTHASPAQRAKMLEIALEDAGADWAEISTFELERPSPSYSWKTAEHFSEKRPEVDWHWIVGADQWERIEQWAEPDRLKERLRFLVVTREGGAVRPRSGWRHQTVEFFHPASSTAIRSDFDAHLDWLTPGVVRYCREEGLYGQG